MDDTSHILLLNTTAVRSLIGGSSSEPNFGQAALLLREALRLIETTATSDDVEDEEERQTAFPQQQQQQQQQQQSCQSPASVLLTMLPVNLLSTASSSSSSLCYHGGDDQSSFFIYDKAFLIAPQVNNNANKGGVLPLSQEQRIKLSTVLLFNLALCFHLQGMKNVRVRERCFREANTIYLMSYGLLLDPETFPTFSPADILLQLALLNNRGALLCCHFLLQEDVHEAQQCLDDLRFALDDLLHNPVSESSSSSSSSSLYSNAISNDDCALFFKNILYNGRLDARAAPVA
jgi:hypothetical protein